MVCEFGTKLATYGVWLNMFMHNGWFIRKPRKMHRGFVSPPPQGWNYARYVIELKKRQEFAVISWGKVHLYINTVFTKYTTQYGVKMEPYMQ
jgi:hypothetical protein